MLSRTFADAHAGRCESHRPDGKPQLQLAGPDWRTPPHPYGTYCPVGSGLDGPTKLTMPLTFPSSQRAQMAHGVS